MDSLIPISELNDFIFCPYSIYLHNVFKSVDRDVYQAKPQVKGAISHKEEVDRKRFDSNIITELPVISEKLGIQGVIDRYDSLSETLIENKYKLTNIYRGQLLQIWAQYYCMTEMDYPIRRLQFHVISTDSYIEISLPDASDIQSLVETIQRFRKYRPTDPIEINSNKCSHCIYNPLCDKTDRGNVYE